MDIAYFPTHGEIYPDGEESHVKTGEAARGLETDFRPHFFDGVVNVVYRLFEHVQPDLAVFGRKDFQQLQVVSDMVESYDLPVTIMGAETVRDDYGLALSSRNAYLSEDELAIARQLNLIIRDLPAGEASVALLEAGFSRVDYVAERWGRVLAAARIGKTRLIDNVAIMD